jgi:hypothetical protein
MTASLVSAIDFNAFALPGERNLGLGMVWLYLMDVSN